MSAKKIRALAIETAKVDVMPRVLVNSGDSAVSSATGATLTEGLLAAAQAPVRV